MQNDFHTSHKHKNREREEVWHKQFCFLSFCLLSLTAPPVFLPSSQAYLTQPPEPPQGKLPTHAIFLQVQGRAFLIANTLAKKKGARKVCVRKTVHHSNAGLQNPHRCPVDFIIKRSLAEIDHTARQPTPPQQREFSNIQCKSSITTT